MTYEFIQTRVEAGKVGIVTLNRPKQLNALNAQLMIEVGQALKAFDADETIGCMILTGNEKSFAAGADIGAMATYTFADVYKNDYITRDWETIRSIRKPIIAASMMSNPQIRCPIGRSGRRLQGSAFSKREQSPLPRTCRRPPVSMP